MEKIVINPKKLVQQLEQRTSLIWDMLCEGYPLLVKHEPPRITLNNRLWRCAGMAYAEDGRNEVQLGTKFFLFSDAYSNKMHNEILPHEVIHIADYRLFGQAEVAHGHGVKWAELMVYYGLPPYRYHSMELPRSFKIHKVK